MRPRWPLLALLALLVAAAAAAVPPLLPPPAVVLHLSDVHFSTNVHGKYWRAFGDREGDAALWANELVPRLGPPAGVVITGDLTDGKTARGEGLQQEAEWLAYAGLLSNLSAAGVPLERVWDLPGNHDVFNMPLRGGPNDFFAKHSAEGRRRSSTQQRVFVHRLPSAATAEAAQQQQQQRGGSPAGCPAAWLVGIDPSPEPGLRSPTNFAGLARPALLVKAHAALLAIRRQHPAGCGQPLILAYCHYPLSTIDSSPAHSAGPPGIILHAAHSVRPMQGLTQLLASHNVSAVFSGHLHSAFGHRLHRLHATPAGGHIAELETAAWKDDRRFRLVAVDGGALSFVDLFFHTRNAPRMPRRPDAAAMQDPAWQESYDRRGWAVTALDPAASVLDHIAFITSPPDGRYGPLGPPQAQQPKLEVEGKDGGASDGASDGGSSGSDAVTGGQQQGGAEGLVRALVYALDAPEGGSAAGQRLEVELLGYLPGGGLLFSKTMQLAAQQPGNSSSGGGNGPWVFEGQGETTVSCVSGAGDPAAHCRPPAEVVDIQVSVKGPGGRTSRSPLQPVALRCAPLTASHQRCWVAAVEGGPLPLGETFVEWLGLGFNWPVLIHRMFLFVWAVQVGAFLLAPRLLARRALPYIAASPLLQCRRPDQLPSTPRGAATSSTPAGLVVQAGRAVLGYLLWPAAALCLCASCTGVWGCLLGYSVYLLVGPWCLYTALSGYPPAMLFHFGVIGQFSATAGDSASAAGGAAGAAAASGSGWHFIPTPDTMFVAFVHLLVCVLPTTLWVACVVARRVQLQPYALLQQSASTAGPSRSSTDSSSNGAGRRMEAGGGSSSTNGLGSLNGSRRSTWDGGVGAGAAGGAGRLSFSVPQLLGLLCLLAFNWVAVYRRALCLMGPTAVLASPGLAWTLPLALLLVVGWGGPSARRPCGQGGKGE